MRLLTLHYEDGQKKYEMRRTIQPGDQMWVSLTSLIRERVPDRKGNILPVEVNGGTYDVQELTPGNHKVMASALAVDSSLGSQVLHPILRCCGADGAVWDPGSFDLVIDGTDFGSIDGTDQCTGQPLDISGDFTSWWSGNTAVATVTTKQVHGVSEGLTDAFASGWVTEGNGGYCTEVQTLVGATVKVQVPTSLALSMGSKKTYGGTTVTDCSGNVIGTRWGYSRCATYTILDQYGTPITTGSYTANESFQTVSSNPPGVPNNTGSANPVAGVFSDFLAFLAKSPPAPQPGEYIKQTQTITITDNNSGKNYSVRTNCLDFEYNDVTDTNITGGGACN